MARFTIGCAVSLTALCIAGAARLGAEETGVAVFEGSVCPPGPRPADQYLAPPGGLYLPAPSEMGAFPDAPPSPNAPSGSSPQSDAKPPSDMPPSADNLPRSEFDTLPPDMTAPDMTAPDMMPPSMATPTFMPTTAATSSEPVAPNMLGDLFGTQFSGAVPVLIDNFFASGDLTAVGGAPDFDITSPVAYSATDMASSLTIVSMNGTMSAPIPMSLTGTTTLGQDAIATADPTLSGPVGIVNNAAVQTAVDSFATSLHGPGTTTFVAEDSTLELNPSLPIVPPLVVVSPDAAWNYNYVILSEAAGLSNPGGAPGAMVGRQKLSENGSPLPHDRVFVNYSYFNNTPLQSGGVNVTRVTPGLEKTFFDGNMSVEVRAPFATTLDSDIIAGGLTDTGNAEFGNLTVYFKALLWDAGFEAISAGLGLTFPTADDVTLSMADGTRLLDIQNESIHLLPFVAGLYMPTERVFVQGMLQLDLDPTGSSTRFTEFVNGAPTGNLLAVGRPNDADYVFFDIGLGYWMYQAPTYGASVCGDCSDAGLGWIQGIAPTMELHYNGTINRADSVSVARGPSTIRIGNPELSEIQLWNLVLGVTFQMRGNADLTLGYATPLNTGRDRQFSSEVRVMFNWFFGGPDRVAPHTIGHL